MYDAIQAWSIATPNFSRIFDFRGNNKRRDYQDGRLFRTFFQSIPSRFHPSVVYPADYLVLYLIHPSSLNKIIQLYQFKMIKSFKHSVMSSPQISSVISRTLSRRLICELTNFCLATQAFMCKQQKELLFFLYNNADEHDI